MKDLVDELLTIQELNVEVLENILKEHADFFTSYRMAISLPSLFYLA